MSLIGFKSYWEPRILDLSKDQTIRGSEKHVGQDLTLAVGVRTSRYRRLGTAVVEDCFPIRFTADPENPILIQPSRFGHSPWEVATIKDAQIIARRDGFVSAIHLHGYFWGAYHNLPWEGFVIRWKDFKPHAIPVPTY